MNDAREELLKRLEAPIGYGGNNSEDAYEKFDDLRLEVAALIRADGLRLDAVDSVGIISTAEAAVRIIRNLNDPWLNAQPEQIEAVTMLAAMVTEPYDVRITEDAATIARLTSQKDALSAAAREADARIDAIHAALGAPGDYGYDSKEGKALFALYSFQQAKLRQAISP